MLKRDYEGCLWMFFFLDEENVRLFIEKDGLNLSLSCLLRNWKKESIGMNLVSIVYFLSHREEIVKELMKNTELITRLETIEMCPSCSRKLIEPHLPFIHYIQLLKLKMLKT
jgi:hypothetical protein